MIWKTTLARIAGLLLCTAMCAGTALAGDKPQDGARAKSGNAPGQEKKAEKQAAKPQRAAKTTTSSLQGGGTTTVTQPSETVTIPGQTSAAAGTLPFTGIPLWIAVLIGAALLAAGLTLRRSA